MIAVSDLQKSIAFYSHYLGFTATIDSPDYAVIERDGASIHLKRAADQSVLDAVRGQIEMYIEVTGIEALWAKFETLDCPTRYRPLFDQPYGMREFHLDDLGACRT